MKNQNRNNDLSDSEQSEFDASLDSEESEDEPEGQRPSSFNKVSES
jgi:hypothetical protein